MNDFSTDLLFLGKISHQLKFFKRKSDSVWNCRCPVCGDSTKNKLKARGYFLRKKQGIFFYCQNCLASHPLWRFLKLYFPEVYGSYLFAKFKKDETPTHEYDATNVTKRIVPSALPIFPEKSIFANCIPISDLPESNAAQRYIRTRRIPRDFEKSLYLAEDFKALCEIAAPDKAKSLAEKEPRIIIPYYNADKRLIGFQGRSLKDNASLRYITIKLDEDEPMVFGLDRVDLDKKVFVLEGPIDSMFIENSIAASGSSLLRFDLSDVDAVYIHDNQPRNKEIVGIIKKTIDAGKTVCIWPDSFTYKDINAAVMAGMSPDDITHIINTSSYKGLEARLKYTKWKKI